MSQQLPEHIEEELDSAFRAVLRDHGVKGVLAHVVGDLIRVTDKVLHQQPLSSEEIAAAIERNGGFIRVGTAEAFIDGHYVSGAQLVDALLYQRRKDAAS